MVKRSRGCSWILRIAAVLVAACSEPTAPEPKLTPEMLAGRYQLVSVNGQSLPANFGGRVTYYSGEYTLHPNSEFASTHYTRVCVPIGCSESTSTGNGTWLPLWDQSLYFHSPGHYGFPHSRIEAARDSFVVCPMNNPTGCAPTLVYERRP